MLVVPHQFGSQAYDSLRPNMLGWGTATMAAGMAMVVVAATGGARWLTLAAHTGVSIALLALAWGFAQTGGWFGTTFYSTLGVGTALAPLLAHGPGSRPHTSDLFALIMGTAVLLSGLVMAAFPGQFVAASFDAMRPYLAWYGVGFVLCGGAVILTQIRARLSWWVRWLALLLLVGAILAPMFVRAFALQAWTGIALYGGSSLVLLARPWLGPFLERRDGRSLATRLAVTFSVSSAVALVAIVTVNANREEASLRSQAGLNQQTLATARGHDVADYVELHEAPARGLAAGPGLLDRDPAEQEAWLRAYGAAYPGVVVFSSLDANGQQLARSDGRPLTFVGNAPWFERIRTTLQPVRIVVRSTSIERAIFGYATPVLGPSGEFRGVVGATIESSRIAAQLSRVVADPGQRAYLVDSQGRTIAHPDARLTASVADLTAEPSVSALLRGEERAGSLVYTADRDEWLAGYARVPSLEWGVVVEQPTSTALATVRIGREHAFAILIVVACVAAAIGAVASRWLTAPLAMLSLAVRRLADGATDAQPGTSGITEIDRLSGVFGEMRERLAARTREHERSELALRQSEEHLRLALQAGRMGTWDWNARTNELAWDGSLEEIHGIPAGTFDGRFETFISIIHADDRQQALAAIQGALETGRQFSVEFRVVWPDGSIHWVAGLGRAYYDEQRAPVRMVGIGLEVTEQRRVVEVERVLAEAGSRLVSSLDYETTLRSVAQLVAATMADYCIVEVRDEDGARSVEIAHADAEQAAHARALLATLEAPEPDDAVTLTPTTLADGAALDGASPSRWRDRPVLVPSLAEAASQHGPIDDPAMPGGEHERLARALSAVSLICVPLLARERTIGALTLISAGSGRRYGPHDLSLAEAIAARAALAVDNARLYSEAQAAIRSRDEFLSIASHELRTPVTGIKGYAQLLLRAHERNRLEGSRLTRSLQAIDEATDRLTTLTRDLLDVSRMRLGQLPLRLQAIDLSEQVRHAAYRFNDRLSPSHELTVDIWAPIPPIQGDADRLEQVLANLLENAIKYSPDGGPIRIELGRAGDEIVLAVRDEGIGLPGDAADAIFRPFGRAMNATQRNLPGMGLGLYICRNIVERHGGRIVARSSGEGYGTTIEITLPYPADAEGPQPDTTDRSDQESPAPLPA
jgi:PAS domain S-box-containing protein